MYSFNKCFMKINKPNGLDTPCKDNVVKAWVFFS